MSPGRSGEGRGLIPDEHRYREAAVRHKRLDLANRRLDARISSLESLATQGTLLAGFGYGTLTRDPGEGHYGYGSHASNLALWSEDSFLMALSEGVISCLAALAVGSAVWVVYLSGYAAIRARIAFLMGSDRLAADDAIQVLRQTHERARDCFDLSLSALVLCASALVVSKMRWYTSLLVVAIFLLFLRDGARFKQQIDARLYPWTARYYHPSGRSRPPPGPAIGSDGWGRCCEPAARLCALLGDSPLLRGLLGRCLGPQPAPPQRPVASSEALGWATSGGRGSEPPRVSRMSSTPSVLRGWMYKTASSRGPLRRGPSRATHRRFFVLRHRRLQIFTSQDRADLSPAYPPSREVQLTHYELVDPGTCGGDAAANEGGLSEAGPFTLALVPKQSAPAPRDGGAAEQLSWYLRCVSAESFATWEARLREACKPDPDAPGSATSSDASSEPDEKEEEDEEGDEGLEEELLEESSVPPLSGSGLAFVRSLFGGNSLRARPGASLLAPARMPTESQMRAAV